jgi:lipoprotein-anchoring transpeptidase ErfK/SrfK
MQTTSLHISVRDQQLTLKSGEQTVRTYPVSTSRFGLGSEEGSMKTPLGQFRIAEKVGAGAPVGTVFESREPAGFEDEQPPDKDLVLSRILWLDGLEAHNANTRDRFIYIHGTNHEHQIGEPASHGCIRMRNADLVELFDLIEPGTPVLIQE